VLRDLETARETKKAFSKEEERPGINKKTQRIPVQRIRKPREKSKEVERALMSGEGEDGNERIKE